MAIISKNSTIYIPTFGEKYTKEISVLVFYPGIPVGGKDGKVYMPPLIQKVVPDWFKKYVIVIPNKHTSDWDLVKSEYSIEMKNVGLVEKNLSVGCFSGSGNSSSSIQKNLSKLSVLNLMLMDPSSTGTIQTNVKTLKSKGTICYLMYNPNNWKSYPDTVAGFKPLSTAVGENVLNTKSVKYDHEDIPGKFLVKWRDIIEKSLTTPTLIDSYIPTTISDGNKQSTENTTPVKTPETSSDSTKKTEVDAKSGVGGTKLKMRIGGLNTDNPVVTSVRSPLNDFTIYVGDPIVTDPNSDEFTDLPELDEEYGENSYDGSEEEKVILENGDVLILFNNGELSRDDGDVVDGDGVGVQVGGSLVVQPGGNVSNSYITLPPDLAAVKNSNVIKNNLNKDIVSPKGSKVTSEELYKNMNQFVTDVLGPFATFLKKNYPDLYKRWYITSATRNNVPKGGSLTSQHMKGQAIDSQIPDSKASNPGDNIKLLNAILTWYQNNPVGYGQILFETRGNSCWIHWAYSRGNTRLMFARFKEDSTLRSASANKTGVYLKPPLTASALGF